METDTLPKPANISEMNLFHTHQPVYRMRSPKIRREHTQSFTHKHIQTRHKRFPQPQLRTLRYKRTPSSATPRHTQGATEAPTYALSSGHIITSHRKPQLRSAGAGARAVANARTTRATACPRHASFNHGAVVQDYMRRPFARIQTE